MTPDLTYMIDYFKIILSLNFSLPSWVVDTIVRTEYFPLIRLQNCMEKKKWLKQLNTFANPDKTPE